MNLDIILVDISFCGGLIEDFVCAMVESGSLAYKTRYTISIRIITGWSLVW